MIMAWGVGLNAHLLNRHVAHLIQKLWGYLCIPMMTSFAGMLSAHIDLSLFFFQWPTLKTHTTLPRSLSFTAINAESHARVKYFGSRPNISTSNVSPAKVWCVQPPGLVACHNQCLPWGLPHPLSLHEDDKWMHSKAQESLIFPNLGLD